ncbi:MAG TPA: ATP-binding protein [Acidobacteriota bacterium]|nr:ATP-binding protein [Acidobacteriota bacterium]
MSSPRLKLSLDELKNLPSWAATMARKYYAGEASHFLLHHNIYDLVRAKGQYVGLLNFLQQEMLGNKNIILYNRSEGITFGSLDAERQFEAQQRVANPLVQAQAMRGMREPMQALQAIERYLYYGEQVAVIINFMETLIPASEVSYMSAEERNLLVMFQRWITSSRLLGSDNIVIFITENVSDVHQRIRENSRLVNIKITYPEQDERLHFIRFFNIMNPDLKMEVTEEQLSHMTSGLNRVHISSMLKSASINQDGLTYEVIRNKKKEIIESECVGLVEFVTPRYGLENVGGMKKAKEFLSNIAETIRSGETEEAPMGILISGPVGTGKTFLAEAFAKDCGLNVVEFKNFRDKWVGSTESNLEKILNLIQNLAPIVVLIDEADATLGNRDSGGGDSGVDQRIFSKVANAMGNTENRAKILWILMTCRPDLLPIDLKRQGRCEEHISLFYPESEEDRQAIIEAMLRKNKISHKVEDWSPIQKSQLKLSGADIEGMLIRCRRVARQAGRKEVLPEDVEKVALEFTPARDEMAVEYQTLVAVREATSRDMLPEAYRHLSPAEISQRIEELRMLTR